MKMKTDTQIIFVKCPQLNYKQKQISSRRFFLARPEHDSVLTESSPSQIALYTALSCSSRLVHLYKI